MINFADMKLSKSRISLYANLKTVKMRRRHGLFTVEGEKGVLDTMRYFYPEALIVTPDAGLPKEVLFKADELYEASVSEMKSLTNFSTPSNIMGVFRIPASKEREQIDSGRLYLMLDGVRDPGNLGTIIRTAHWFGVTRIFASYDSVDCYNPKVVQAAMGSLGPVTVEYADLENIIRENPDLPVYGTLLEGEDIFKATLSQNGFVVMGNEGQGISGALLRRLTKALNIPPATACHGESLNVAVATGVVLAQFESFSGRRKSR